MTNYLIQLGDSLSKIANRFGVSVKQLQETNGIKNPNLIFAGKALTIPDINSSEAFNIKGLHIERTTSPTGSETPAAPTRSEQPLERGAAGGVSEMNGQVAASVVRTASQEVTEQAFTNRASSSPSVVDNGNGTPPQVMEGERAGGSWKAFLGNDSPSMVCRDASGRTQNISGKFNVVGEFKLSDDLLVETGHPGEFTITDNSSGEDHVYLYKKIAVNDNGQPIYKCVSMNGDEIATDNQYTLEWKDDYTPELVQRDGQDNFGVGLKFRKTSKITDGPAMTAAPDKGVYNADGSDKGVYNADGSDKGVYNADAPDEQSGNSKSNPRPVGLHTRPTTKEDLENMISTGRDITRQALIDAGLEDLVDD